MQGRPEPGAKSSATPLANPAGAAAFAFEGDADAPGLLDHQRRAIGQHDPARADAERRAVIEAERLTAAQLVAAALEPC